MRNKLAHLCLNRPLVFSHGALLPESIMYDVVAGLRQSSTGSALGGFSGTHIWLQYEMITFFPVKEIGGYLYSRYWVLLQGTRCLRLLLPICFLRGNLQYVIPAKYAICIFSELHSTSTNFFYACASCE